MSDFEKPMGVLEAERKYETLTDREKRAVELTSCAMVDLLAKSIEMAAEFDPTMRRDLVTESIGMVLTESFRRGLSQA